MLICLVSRFSIINEIHVYLTFLQHFQLQNCCIIHNKHVNIFSFLHSVRFIWVSQCVYCEEKNKKLSYDRATFFFVKSIEQVIILVWPQYKWWNVCTKCIILFRMLIKKSLKQTFNAFSKDIINISIEMEHFKR